MALVVPRIEGFPDLVVHREIHMVVPAQDMVQVGDRAMEEVVVATNQEDTLAMDHLTVAAEEVVVVTEIANLEDFGEF